MQLLASRKEKVVDGGSSTSTSASSSPGETEKKSSGEFAFGRVLDCGAGVGRISEGLLLEVFKEVQLLEPVGHLIKEARI